MNDHHICAGSCQGTDHSAADTTTSSEESLLVILCIPRGVDQRLRRVKARSALNAPQANARDSRGKAEDWYVRTS